MVWRIEDPQGDEAAKIKYDVAPYTRGIVLDLGAGPTRTYPHWITVDNCIDRELFGIDIQPQVTADCARLADSIHAESVDAIFSSHLLEHIVDYRAALEQWWACIKPGGYLVLYLPHKDFYPNIGKIGANPDHKHDFHPHDIIRAISDFAPGFDLVVNESRNGGNEYSFLQVYRKNDVGDFNFRTSFCLPKPGKTVCVVRYGGFGDMLQAANILPELQRQGYHVTVMTTPKGQDILRHDPHVDAWLIQDEDQVPNHELSAYWDVWRKKFSKFVNLCESVEGTLLAMPGRANHMWPDNMRRQRLNDNYLEFTAELAELPYVSESKFYATFKEQDDALSLLGRTGGNDTFHLLWALSGSSIHKFYPHQDQVIAKLLDQWPQLHVILAGDPACKILEAGWEEHPRVTLTAGELSIRDTLALAQMVDCVVGPETGVLNAVAFEPDVGKVILLSHSSAENLTKHWLNAEVLASQHTPCYPCHRLHYGREFCHEHVESGAAMCQADIAPYAVASAIGRIFAVWFNRMGRAA